MPTWLIVVTILIAIGGIVATIRLGIKYAAKQGKELGRAEIKNEVSQATVEAQQRMEKAGAEPQDTAKDLADGKF